MTPLRFELPLKTKSLNESFRGDWRARAGTAKAQRNTVRRRLPAWPGGPLLAVTLTRVSRGRLDDDAVPAALKHVRDAVALWLRLDDASPLVTWDYAQEHGPAPLVRIEVTTPTDWRPARQPATPTPAHYPPPEAPCDAQTK